jgi:hypothetical protein
MKLPMVAVLVGLATALSTALAATASAAAPSNDVFANAAVISSLPFSDTVDTTQATSDSDDTEGLAACGASVPDHASVWYAYTPPTDQTVSVDTSGSSYTVGVGVFTGAPGSLSAVACAQGSANFSAVAGQTYHIGLPDISGGNGGSLHLSVTAPTPPDIDFSVDRFGRFDSRTGAATVTGTATCTPGASGYVQVSLSEAVGRVATISGYGFASLDCDGSEQHWSAPVQPFSGKYAGGQAKATADAYVCNQLGCASGPHIDQAITLRK